jgi:hypothetical protein
MWIDPRGDGKYKCDCRALLYAMKYNTERIPAQYLGEMNNYNRMTQDLLRRYANVAHVSIPTRKHCTGHWWRRRCHTVDVKPNPRFAVVLEEPIDEEEEEDLLEAD